MTTTGKIIQTAPIAIPADVTALEGMRVQYRHYNTFADLMTGTIEQAKVTKFGIEVYICPDKDSSSLPLLSKWRNLANDSVVKIVEDEPQFKHRMLERLYRMQVASKNPAELYKTERPDYLKGE